PFGRPEGPTDALAGPPAGRPAPPVEPSEDPADDISPRHLTGGPSPLDAEAAAVPDRPEPTAKTTPTPSANGYTPTPARIAGRVRRSPSATAAEQAAVDLALLRTFGVAGPATVEPDVELEGCPTDD